MSVQTEIMCCSQEKKINKQIIKRKKIKGKKKKSSMEKQHIFPLSFLLYVWELLNEVSTYEKIFWCL